VHFLKTCLILAVFCGNINASGCSNDSLIYDRIFSLIYSQQFDRARAELSREENKLDILHYQILLLDLYWWEAITNSSTDFSHLKAELQKTSEYKGYDLEHQKLLELIRLSYSFRIAAAKNHMIASMIYFTRINGILEHAEPARLTSEQQEIFRLYRALINIGKSHFNFGSRKIRKENIEFLVSRLNSPVISHRTIAYYFLSKIYADMEMDYVEALGYCEELCRLYPDNTIFISNLKHCREKVSLIQESDQPGMTGK
jgi:hypothetical protein